MLASLNGATLYRAPDNIMTLTIPSVFNEVQNNLIKSKINSHSIYIDNAKEKTVALHISTATKAKAYSLKEFKDEHKKCSTLFQTIRKFHHEATNTIILNLKLFYILSKETTTRHRGIIQPLFSDMMHSRSVRTIISYFIWRVPKEEFSLTLEHLKIY